MEIVKIVHNILNQALIKNYALQNNVHKLKCSNQMDCVKDAHLIQGHKVMESNVDLMNVVILKRHLQMEHVKNVNNIQGGKEQMEDNVDQMIVKMMNKS